MDRIFQLRNGKIVEVGASECDCLENLKNPESELSRELSNLLDAGLEEKLPEAIGEKLPEVLEAELANPDSETSQAVKNKVDAVVQDKIDSGEIGSGAYVPERPDLGVVAKPVITTPANGAEVVFNGDGVGVATSAFSYTGESSDSHTSTDWKICADLNGKSVIAEATESADLTSHIFGGLNLGDGATCYAFARFHALNRGASDWSAGVAFVARRGSVGTPAVTAPAAGAEILSGSSFTVASSAFVTTRGNDSHKATTWLVSEASNGTNPLAEVRSETDLTSHTFSGLTLEHGKTYYVFCKHEGAKFGESGLSAGVAVTGITEYVAKPTLVAPENGATILMAGICVGTSSFTVLSSNGDKLEGSDNHAASQYRIRDAVTGNTVYDSGECSDLVAHVLANVPEGMADGKSYLLEARHKGARLGWSAWSASVRVTVVERMPFSSSQEFLEAGDYTFTVPDNVSRVRVLCVGGGAVGDKVGKSNAPGGKGGGIISAYINLTPGQSVAVKVGAVAASGGTSSCGDFLQASGGTTASRGMGSKSASIADADVVCNLDSIPDELGCASFEAMSLNEWSYVQPPNVNIAFSQPGENGDWSPENYDYSTMSGVVFTKGGGEAGEQANGNRGGTGGKGKNGGNGGKGGDGVIYGGIGGTGGDATKVTYYKLPNMNTVSTVFVGYGGAGGIGAVGGAGGQGGDVPAGVSYAGQTGGRGGDGGGLGGPGGTGGYGRGQLSSSSHWYGGGGGRGGDGLAIGGNGGNGGDGGNSEYGLYGFPGNGGNGSYGGNGGNGGAGRSTQSNYGNGGNGGPGCVVVFY